MLRAELIEKPNPPEDYLTKRFATSRDRELASCFRIPVRIAMQARVAWEQCPTPKNDFGSFADYLAYRAEKHRADADRRALRRAIETNPFTLPQAIATARAFGAAIDALPVGRDIRNRLHARLDAHIDSLQALVAPSEAGDGE